MSEQSLEQFIVLLKTENYLLKNRTIGNRLLFSESGNTLKLLVPKIETGVSFFLIVIYF